MTTLNNKNAFITGGGSGIGFACAQHFASRGANVLIMGRNTEKLDKAAAELRAAHPNVDIKTHSGDVSIEADVIAAVEQASHGGLDITVANAGIGGLAPIMVTEGESWDSIMQTNLSGTFYTIKHAGRAMAKSGGGSICIDMRVRNCADELGVANIRVNSVCPGLVDTEIAAGLMTTEDVLKDYLECMPISRTGVVEDIANAVGFLCGPDSSWITGVTLSVDGGHHLRRGPNVEPFSRMLFGDDITEGKV